MWLRLGSTNHDPHVILQYYLEVVDKINGYYGIVCLNPAILYQELLGCPSVIRMDKGTENILVASVQYALRSSHDDTFAGDKSFRYGSCPANIVRDTSH